MILSAFVLLGGGYAALKATRNSPAPVCNTDSVYHGPSLFPEPAGWHLLTAASEIQWKAGYITGGGHHGTLQLKDGNLQTGKVILVSGGWFLIDMNSVQGKDQAKPEDNKSLEAHLKSEDFLGTEQFPLASFKVTGSSLFVPAEVKGDLTIKNITRHVEIPFVWRVQNDTLYVQGHLNIDRRQWGISNKPDNITGAVKDAAISNTIELVLNLRFKRIDNC